MCSAHLLIVATVLQKDLEIEAEFGQSSGKSKDGLDKDSISKRLEEIYKRLELIDADAAEARAASILAVCFISLFVPLMSLAYFCSSFDFSTYLDYTSIFLSSISMQLCVLK
jgi:hypothetical protein